MILTVTVKGVQRNNGNISWPPEGEHHSFNRLTAKAAVIVTTGAEVTGAAVAVAVVGDTVGTLVDLCARILFMMTCSGL